MNPNSQIQHQVVVGSGDPPEKLREKYAGVDNRGTAKVAYLKHIQEQDDEAFVKSAETTIWLSAFANNNPRSDYHWQADACYDEAQRRGNPDLYKRAFNKARASAG